MKKLFAVILVGLLLPIFSVLGATFGDTIGGGNWLGFGGNFVEGYKIELLERGEIQEIKVKIKTDFAPGPNIIEGAIYGSTGNFIAKTEQIDLPNSTTDIYSLIFTERPILEAGWYWLIIHTIGENPGYQFALSHSIISPIENVGLYNQIVLPSTISANHWNLSYLLYAVYEYAPEYETIFDLPGTAVDSTTGIITDLFDAIGPFIWLFIGIPLGFLVVKRIIKIIPRG